VTTVSDKLVLDNGNNAGRDVQWQPSNDRLAFFNDVKATFGNGADLSLYHNGSNSFIVNNNGYLSIQSQAGVGGIFIQRNAEVNIYYGGSVRLQTSSSGVTINRDIDVDGHTNLDNVSIAGVTTAQAFQATTGTFTGDVDIASSLVHTGDTDTKISFATNTIKFDTNTAERLRINSSGQLITGGSANPFPTRVLTLQPAQGQTNNYLSII
ncbi:MAG: hypothetical protein VXY93_18220, partial [Pseudomonadota bacterium]|nr:hypothetical protein [Pseudomonadota bacterium]